MAASSERSLLCPVLIGRARYIDALRELLPRVRLAQGETLLIRGEPGVGKSRLLREARRVAGDLGFTYLQGACFETDRALPYGPILDLLRAYAASASDTELAEVVDARELVMLLPELGSRLSDAPSIPALDSGQERRRLFEALTRVFSGLAARQPLVLGIEDIHWCDDTSLEFLRLLARRVASQPILLVLTYRSDEAHLTLRQFLAQLERERLASEWTLAPLSAEQVDEMLQAIFELKRPAPLELRTELFDLTEGNPFFIEETLKSLAVAGEIFYADGRWNRKAPSALDIPRSVQDAVQRRTEHLSPEAREALILAAVVGQRFPFDLLLALTQRDEGDLLRLLKELIAAQLVVELSDDQFAFRHALTRRAVHADLLARERRTLHRQIAEAMERIYSDSLELILPDLADHFYAAGAWEQALDYGWRSGRRAMALFAPRGAVEQFTHALQAAQRLALPAPSDLLLERGQAYETLGEPDQARQDFEQGAERARADHDGHAEWRGLMALGKFWAGQEYHQAGEWFQKSSALAEALGDPSLQAYSLNRLANWYVNLGRTTEGIRTHQQALTIFEAQHDEPGLAETLDLLGMAHLLHGDAISSVEFYDRAIEMFRRQNNALGLASALATRPLSNGLFASETSYSLLATPEDCQRDGQEALALLRKIESPVAQAYADLTMASWQSYYGEFGTALTHARAALALATEIGHQQWRVASDAALGRLLTLIFDTEQAIGQLETGLSLARALGSAYWAGTIRAFLADACLQRRDHIRARATLEAGMPERAHPHNLGERRMLWAWGELMLAEGDAQEAILIVERLQRSAPGTPRAQPIPWLLKTKGEALAALGQMDEAAQTLQAARLGAEQRHERSLLWKIDLALGRLYRRARDAERAEEAFDAARGEVAALAASLDDVALRGRFVEAAQRLLPHDKPPSGRRAHAQQFGGLTERECEVAALVAQGKTNREIADALVVSARTVDTHVSAILSKLRVPSRARIALWAVEVGLVQADA